MISRSSSSGRSRSLRAITFSVPIGNLQMKVAQGEARVAS